MVSKALIYKEWEDVNEFYKFKELIENSLTEIHDFSYLIYVDDPKIIEMIPRMEDTFFITKKEFNWFGSIKNARVLETLKDAKFQLFLITIKELSKPLKRMLKVNEIRTLGVQSESLPPFDISFMNIEKLDENYYKKVNKYLTKIQIK